MNGSGDYLNSGGHRAVGGSLFAALALTALLIGCAGEDRSLTLAVSTEEPAPSIAASASSVLSERGFSIVTQPVGNPQEAIDAVLAGQTDLAIIDEPDHAIAGLITVAPLYPGVLHVLYRGPKQDNFAKLLGTGAIYAGPVGGVAHRLLLQLAADFGMDSDGLQILENPWVVSPDVYFIFGGLLPPESLSQLDGYQLYSFASRSDAADGSLAHGIALKHPHLHPFLLPRGVYPQLSADAVLTLSNRSVLVANETLDSDVAYDVAAALFAAAPEIAVAYPLVTHELNESMNTGELMLPLHEGSRRYLERDRPGFIERHVEVLALYLTIVLALISGAVWLWQHRTQKRKDRVDEYHAALLGIRTAMSDSAPDAGALRQRVLDVQNEVMTLLIDERIAADAGLVAFVSLSNQILDELSRLDTTLGHS